MDDAQVTGARIRELREAKKMSQEELARELKTVTTGQLSQWELGKAEPRAHNVRALARFFGVPSDYVLGLKDTAR